MGHIDVDYYISEDNISISQIRKILLLSYDIEVNPTSLDIYYKDERCSLKVSHEDNLYLDYGGGVQIYLYDADNIRFEEIGDYIYLTYQRKGKEYEFNIGQEKGISISDVSNCVPNDSDDNNS